MKKTLKKTLSIILAILMVVTIIPMAFAADVVASGNLNDEITWELDAENNLIISGTGAMPDGIDWYYLTKCYGGFYSIIIEEGITAIGACTFKDISADYLEIPHSVTEIGFKAFDCSHFGEIIMPSSIEKIGQEMLFAGSATIHYLGSQEQWDNIDNEYDWVTYDLHCCEEKAEVSATCEDKGVEQGWYCNSCKKYAVGGAEISELGHDIIIDKAVAPTCTETGLTEGQYCSRCDDMTVAQEEIPVLGHADEDGDGVCDNGGEQLTCEDCGSPVHGESFFENLICMIKMLVNLIKSVFA